MREILFEGKRLDNGEWIQSDSIMQIKGQNPRLWVEYEGWVEVIPETVGEYIGIVDKNGNKIFEGDIVLYSWLSFGEPPFCIEFIDGEFCATPLRQTDDLWQIRISGENLNFEVIGNIHDNNLEEKQ